LLFFAQGVDICELRRYNAQKGNGVFGQNAQRPRFISKGNGVFGQPLKDLRFLFEKATASFAPDVKTPFSHISKTERKS
jgi:hypothetical protein